MSLSAPFAFPFRTSFIASKSFTLDTDFAVDMNAINSLGGIASSTERIAVVARRALFPEKLSARLSTSSILHPPLFVLFRVLFVS